LLKIELEITSKKTKVVKQMREKKTKTRELSKKAEEK
jgi:hypothetical protein